MKIENFQYQDRNHGQLMCSVDFGEDANSNIVLTLSPAHSLTPQTITFGKDFVPVKGDFLGMIYDITKIQGEGNEPSFRHALREDKSSHNFIDYPVDGYVQKFEKWYDVLDMTIDRLPNGAQKQLLRGNFDKAAKELGYQPIKQERTRGS